MADTHALWWFLKSPERLSAAATAVFRLAATGNATIVVPAIVVAEFYFLSVKLGQPIAPADLLARLDAVGSIEVTDLGRAQLARLELCDEIPEMHDRLIAAESLTLEAPVLTRDESLTASPQIPTIW
ncbi:MAG: PIN domain-containing protein [Chloroflexota bacterium]|nr:PIN domain-containing protein [Chloroflexota bacterium]